MGSSRKKDGSCAGHSRSISQIQGLPLTLGIALTIKCKHGRLLLLNHSTLETLVTIWALSPNTLSYTTIKTTKQAHLNQILELPQLDSPPLSTSLLTKESFEPSAATSDDHREDYNAQFVDWKAIDRLLTSQLADPTSYSNSNIPVATLDSDANADFLATPSNARKWVLVL